MRFTYRCGDQVYAIEIDKTTDGFRAGVNGEVFEARVLKGEDGELAFLSDGRVTLAYWAAEGERRWVAVDGRTFILETGPGGGRREQPGAGHTHSGDNVLRAPMPGQVRGVQVPEGGQVEKGQTVLLLEAMKMELRIQAPRAGRLARLLVRPGQSVERDQALGEIE